MNVIIIGAGEVGLHIASILSREAHNVTIVDRAQNRIERVTELLDIGTICGHGANPGTLAAAGAESADLALAVTNNDEVNLIAAMTSKALGAAKVVARVRSQQYLDIGKLSYRDLLHIDLIINPVVFTAYEVAKFVENPDALAIESFARGRIEMRQIRVQDGSALAGKPLKEIALEPGTLIGSIMRDDALIIPHGSSVIRADDVVTIIGQKGHMDRMQKLITGAETKVRNVMVFGGNQIGLLLSQLLENLGCAVKLFEENRAHCQALAEQLARTTVVHGNAADLELLKSERVGSADAFIAVTDDDERNIMSVLLAKELGARKGIVITHKPDFALLLEKVGIDHAISPRLITANRILGLVRRGELYSTAILADGKAEAIEVRVGQGAKIAGRTLKQVRFPRNTLIAAVIRDEHVIVPRGTDAFHEGDTVVAFAQSESIDELLKLFQPPKSFPPLAGPEPAPQPAGR
jgi:trk system potassium uptake protein TrkA